MVKIKLMKKYKFHEKMTFKNDLKVNIYWRYVKLKRYSHILCGVSAENLDFSYFVLIWWQIDKKTRNPDAELQGPVYLDRTANCLINYRIR